MTPAQFSAALARLGFTQAGASAVLGVTDRAIRMWLTGARSVPAPVAKLMRLMADGKIAADTVRDA